MFPEGDVAFDGNKSNWLGEIDHVFDDPVAPIESAGAARPETEAEAATDAPRWHRTLSESPYRMAAHPMAQEEVVSADTLARWRGQPSPDRRRRARARERSRGEVSPAPQYSPSSSPDDMLRRARNHVAEIESLRAVGVSPMQTTLQRKPWRNGMSTKPSKGAVAHGRRATGVADAPYSVADHSQPSPSAHMPSVRRAQAATERRNADSPTKLKPLGPGPKAAAKPSARPTRSSNVMVTNMLSGASKSHLKTGEPNPIAFRIAC
eukprot:COSAG01_NODE_17707_length_1130_cov_1.091174_1_plen_263_part_10